MLRNWSGNYRADWHDYTKRQIYHLTLMKNPDVELFGVLAGDWRLPVGTRGRSYVKASPVGRAIKQGLLQISTIHPALRILQYALMPDHVHILLAVEDTLDEILGRKIAAFKVMVNSLANVSHIFAKGFNDQIVSPSRALDPIFTYLRENPYRLAIRFANPEYFSRVNKITVGGYNYCCYGNFHLLEHPFKDQVVIHRKDDPAKKAADKNRWLYLGANGGVLVSPFISPAEKAIRIEAEEAGGKTILFVHEAMSEKFKPAARDFGLCAEGRLLIISLGLPAGTPLLRSHCLKMNELAQTLAETPIPLR